MAFRQLRVSDLSGRDLDDSEVVTVTVKSAGKVFDAHIDELSSLKTLSSVEQLDLRLPNGETKTVLLTKAEFSKLVPEDKLAGFDSSRGRRSGFSPVRNGATV